MGGGAFFGAKDAERQRKKQEEQFAEQMAVNREQMDFQREVQAENIAERRRQNVRGAPNASLGWLQAIQGLQQGAGKSNGLDVLGYLSGGQ